MRPTSAYVFALNFTESPDLLLADVSALLYDLELSHDFAVLLTDADYKSYEFNRYFWLRSGRPLRPDHRVRVGRVAHQSPFFLEVVVPTIAGIWGLIQILDAVDTWKLKREKLELEVRKLRREEERDRVAVRDAYVRQISEALETQEQKRIHEQLIKRLTSSQLRLDDANVRYARLEQEAVNDREPKV